MLIDDDSCTEVSGKQVREVKTNASGFRLLPWRGASGKRCYLSTDDPNGLVSRVADEVERSHTTTAEQVLDCTRALLDAPKTDPQSLRFALRRMCEAMADLLLVAESRGERLYVFAPEDPDEEDLDADGPNLPAEAFG